MRTPTWKSDIGDITTAIRKYCNYHLPSGAESATVLNVKKIRGSEPCWIADVEYSYGYQNGEKMTTIQQEEFPCDSEIFMYSSRRNEMNSKKSSRQIKSSSQAEIEGYNCGHKGGGDLDDNPYDKDTQNEQWDDWRRGYSEGDEDRIHSSRRNEMNSKKSIKSSQSNMWEEGYQAYYDGEGYADYPTGLSQSEAEDWMSGYDFANKEDQAGHSPIKQSIKSSFNYYDGFEDDVRYFAEQHSDEDDIVEMVAGDIENDHPTESPEEFESLMRAVQVELKKQGYFKQPWQVNSALDTIKVTFDNGDVITTDYNADVGREEIAKYYYGNWFNVGDENEMHKVVKVEFPGAENINSNKEPADMDMAYQLEGYIESDGDLYRQMIVPVIKNLERKVQKGIYDYDKSLIAWQHVADEGARRYVKELGGPAYNVATRKEVAKKLSEYYEENYMGDNPISSSRITSSNEDKADENGPHMKFKELDPDYEFELREQIEDELEILLNKLKVNFTTDVWEETVQYILSYFKEDNAYNPKNAKQAVHEWYLETKEYFPEMFDTKKQKLASARYIRWIISKTCI